LGYRLAGFVDRRPKQARVAYGFLRRGYRRLTAPELASHCDVLFITTPDSAIRRAFESARRRLRPGTIVVHCSGALGVDVFGDAPVQGLDVLAFHPVQSFASHSEGIDRLPGSFFAIEGTRRGLRFGRELVAALGGECLVVPGGDRPLYHAMCVFGSNFVTALLASGEEIAVALGMTRRRALSLLGPLASAVICASCRLGTAQAMTGPAARGDVTTIERHLAALHRSAPELVSSYRALTLRLVPIAVRQGLGRAAAARLRRALVG
jgi:predicted short-subunit dehydrogenase-like oxidoreductase (DUF2520 family)